MDVRLDLVCSTQSWWLRAPPDLPLDIQLQRLFGKKREAVEALLSCSYPLSEGLRKRIATDVRHHSGAGFLCQMCLGICLPSGLLTGTAAWDYDRDMDVLRREAAAVLGGRLAPEEYDLQERIDSEASWADGKRLFTVYVE